MTSEKNKDTARLETRLPKEQKLLFKKAARLGGYNSLSDFIVKTAREKADKIIAESEQILATERDSKIFFDAITKPPKANKELKKAAKEYKAIVTE